jgi:hypothetical protein
MKYKLIRHTYGDWYIMCTACHRDVWWKFWKPIPRYHVLNQTFCDCRGKNESDSKSTKQNRRSAN